MPLSRSQQQQRLTFYDVLGLPMDASDADVAAAYKRRLVQCHPATCRPHDNDSFCYLTEEEAKQSALAVRVLQKAFTVLSNPKLRGWYDAQLLGPRAAATLAAQREHHSRAASAQHMPTLSSPPSLTDALTTRRPPPPFALPAERGGGASHVDTREDVAQFTTEGGGHVRVVAGRGVDPTDGAVYRYKTVAYTHTAAGPATAAAEGQHSSPAPAAGNANEGKAAVRPGGPAPSAVLIQDFDPSLLALLPNRAQALLSQLLSAPLPVMLEPPQLASVTGLVAGGGGESVTIVAVPSQPTRGSSNNSSSLQLSPGPSVAAAGRRASVS